MIYRPFLEFLAYLILEPMTVLLAFLAVLWTYSKALKWG